VLFIEGCRFLSFERFWKKVIKQCIDDLDNIISKCPATTKKMVVYRGVKDDYYLNGTPNHIYKTDSFVSTSINLISALDFAGKNCCFKRITIMPGTRLLLMACMSVFQNEFEFLLGRTSQFYITKNASNVPRLSGVCIAEDFDFVNVSDLVVVK
jgi:hypothetical protein